MKCRTSKDKKINSLTDKRVKKLQEETATRDPALRTDRPAAAGFRASVFHQAPVDWRTLKTRCHEEEPQTDPEDTYRGGKSCGGSHRAARWRTLVERAGLVPCTWWGQVIAELQSESQSVLFCLLDRGGLREHYIHHQHYSLQTKAVGDPRDHWALLHWTGHAAARSKETHWAPDGFWSTPEGNESWCCKKPLYFIKVLVELLTDMLFTTNQCCSSECVLGRCWNLCPNVYSISVNIRPQGAFMSIMTWTGFFKICVTTCLRLMRQTIWGRGKVYVSQVSH